MSNDAPATYRRVTVALTEEDESALRKLMSRAQAANPGHSVTVSDVIRSALHASAKVLP